MDCLDAKVSFTLITGLQGFTGFKLPPPATELAVNETANNASLHTHHEVGEASLQHLTLVPCFEQL